MPGTPQVANGVGVAIIGDQVRFDSLNPVDVLVQTPAIKIVPSPQNIPYRLSTTIKLTWIVCTNKVYSTNVAGDCYYAPTPDNTGVVTTPMVVNWSVNGGVWTAPNAKWSYAPRNWATLGQGRFLFPLMTITSLNGDNFVTSIEVKPTANQTGAIIVNTLSTTTSIGDLNPAIRVGSATYGTQEQATIQVGSVPVNYDYFLRDSIRTTIDVPINVWACPANHAQQPANFWEVSNTIKNKNVTRGNINQFVAGMAGCRVITVPCPECYQITDRTKIPLAIRTISLPASDLLLANLQANQQASIKLYAVQSANIKALDRNTGDTYQNRIFSVGRPTTVRVVAAGRLPVIQPPAIVDLNNLGDAANNAAGDAALADNADNAAIDQAPAAAGDAAAAAPAAADAGAGAAPAANAGSGGAADQAAPSAAPSGLAAGAGFDLTASPLAGTAGVGTNAGTTLRLRIPLTQTRGKVLPLRAYISPKAAGSLKFVLMRKTASGKLVVGKVKTATVVKGNARAAWILAKSKPSGAYTVYASYRPAKGSRAKGVTVSQAVRVR